LRDKKASQGCARWCSQLLWFTSRSTG